MQRMGCQVLCCSRCRHYTPEGRRGGHCDQLGVPVQGRWNACSLSMPVFATAMPDIHPLELLPQPIEIHLPDPVTVPEEVPTYVEPPLAPVRRLTAA
jgi:hypothetical protein